MGHIDLENELKKKALTFEDFFYSLLSLLPPLSSVSDTAMNFICYTPPTQFTELMWCHA